jgi:hypothetical protein
MHYLCVVMSRIANATTRAHHRNRANARDGELQMFARVEFAQMNAFEGGDPSPPGGWWWL